MPGPNENRVPSGRQPSASSDRKPGKASSGQHETLGTGLNDTKSGAEQSVPFPTRSAQHPAEVEAPSPVWVADAIARATTGVPHGPGSQHAAAPHSPPPRAHAPTVPLGPPLSAAPPPSPEGVSKRRSLPRLQCSKCNIVYSGALPKDQKCMECKGPLVDADPVTPPLSPRTSDPRHDTFMPASPPGSPLLWAPGSSKRSELLVTRYMIKDPTADILGSGAKGVVYRAHDRRMGDRPVAIKLFFDDGFDDPEAKKEQSRTEREIRIQAALTHPAIVTAHDRFESPHGSGIVLEYIDGESLEERVKKKGALPVRDAARVTSEVAKAVEYMHSKGIIHRDLKPANVLLTREGNVKLIDFGVAKYKDDPRAEVDSRDPRQAAVSPQQRGKTGALTREGTIIGTPSYMSPEQALGRVSFVDERSDIYGIGAILYFALTGKPPFIGDDVEAILDRVRKLPPPPPSTWNGKVDKALEAIVQKALAKLPEQRFETAGKLVEQLRRYVEGERIDPAIYLEPRVQRATRWLAENRGIVVGVLGLLLALTVAFAAYEWASHVSAQRTNRDRLQQAGEKLNSINSSDVSAAIALYTDILKDDPGNEEARLGLEAAYKAQVHVNLYNEGKALLDEALAKQQAGEDAEPIFDRAHYKLRDANALKSPARDLPKLIELARGVAKLDVATPEHAPADARLELVQLSPDDLSKQQLAVSPPPTLPVTGLTLLTGLYQATIVGTGLDPISFPVRIARGTDVTIEPIPQAPPGMVYVRGHPKFRAGHPRHDDLAAAPVEPFFIDAREVTVGEYREFLSSIKDPGLKKRRTPSHWTDAAMPEPADAPVTNIAFDDALAYAAFRGKDIPTEAQWQLAASGGLDDRDYPYGRKFVAAYERCDTAGRPDQVGKHQHDRSPFGILDMSGNVSELVRGFFDVEGTKRLAKGGSFAKKAPLWERIPMAGPDRTTGFRCSKSIH